MVYQWCVVPQCTNTSTKTPEKLFISVPKKANIRKKWLQLARRDPNDIVVTSSVYFCEDHFDLEKTILNYNQYNMGFSERLHIADGVLPSKFTCQQDRRKGLCHASSSPGAYITRQRLDLIQECMGNTQSIMKNTTETSNQFDGNEIQEYRNIAPFAHIISYPRTTVNYVVKKIQPKAILSINPDMELSDTHQRSTDKQTEIHIANGVDKNVEIKIEKDNESTLPDDDRILFTHRGDVEIKIERDHKSMLVDNGTLVKQEPVDTDSVETWHNVHDSCIDVVKEEVCSDTSKNSETSDNNMDTAAYIEIHMEEHYSCSVCTYQCKQSANLKRHMRIHTGDKPFACDFCQFKCADQPNLKRHMRTHIGDKPFSCDFCQLKFSQSNHLKRHLLTHSGEKPYKCSICNYRSNQYYNLNKHNMKIHAASEKSYVCSICNYKCNQQCDLDRHLKTHTHDKPYACNVCEYKSADSNNIRRHMRIHTGEKPYKCNVCQYKCSQSDHLKKHIRTHTGEKPYSCSVCPFKTATSSGLKSHIRIHSCD